MFANNVVRNINKNLDKMRQDIRPINAKGQLHGYVELFIDRGCWLKGMFKNDFEVGYVIENKDIHGTIDDYGSDVIFYIR